MAASLRTKVVERSIKTNTAAYYSYIDDSKNPVLQSFESQISDFKNYVAKQQKLNDTIDGRLSETLFQLWSSFQPRVSVRLYCEKLMHLGEFLVAHEKYNLALFQCYQRYLNEFGAFHMQDFQTTDQIEERFFPLGLADITADISFQALMGCALCLFYLSIEQDPKVQLDETLDRCLVALSFIRLLMNLALKDDRWSWLVYNGTIYLYKMGRYLMTLGYSLQVVEYLVWAAVSTEMCLPLLSIAYLPWRSTLYCSACEAFYDSRIAPDGERAIAGENFARRALEQFKNLHELQSMSIEGDKCQYENSFRHATIKIATMLFKRTVFESRRKAKGILRPKVRQNYKDISGAWPRTLTEKLLGDMFDCRCAQFLAILQALSDSNRRLLLTSPASEQEIELLDVTAELFYAAQYILQVKHANLDQNSGANMNSLYPNITLKENNNLLELAVTGQYVIPLSYAIQLFKLAFNYQVNDVFESMMEPISDLVDQAGGSQTSVLALLQILYEIEQCDRDRKIVQNLKNTRAVKNTKETDTKKQRGKSPSKVKEVVRKKSPENVKEKLKTPKAIRDLIDTAKGTRSLSNTDSQANADQKLNDERTVEELLEDLCFLLLMDPQIHEKIEPDVLIDVCLLLWNKCRAVLRRFYNEPNDNSRWLTRLDHNHIKWIHLCFQTHEIMSRFNFAVVDASAYAECSLRLGQILFTLLQPSSSIQATIRSNCYKQRFEQLRDSLINNTAKPILQDFMDELKRQQTVVDNSIIKDAKNRKQQSHSADPHSSSLENNTLTSSYYFPLVFFAEHLLARSLKILAQARSNLIRSDGSSLFDRNWSAKSNDDEDETDTFNQIRFLATQPFQLEKGHTSKLMDNLVKDLDAELHFVYCRIAALLEQTPDANAIKKGPIDQYLTDARGNSHKKALLCAAYASTRRDENLAAEYMQKAYKHLLAAEEEDRLYFWHHQNHKTEKQSNTTVPRPCIIARAPDFVFVMAPDFGSLSNKVATYRIFCRAADRPNAKARMADTNHPGSGQQIPASFIKPVKISGLNPDLKYVFSLAIYDINGQLIGESVSESTEPILAANPISLLFIRCLLSQVSYEIKQYTVAKKAFHSIWTYFVRTPAKIESSIRELSVENPLIIYELRYACVAESSISLLQKFINSIFINLEIFIKENHYYCDMITPTSSNRANQINRIHACSQILIALELSSWLNDSQYTLQSVIYLYGLLTPLIFYKIFYPSIHYVFDKCLAVLEEISQQITKQRLRITQENIYHMIACMTSYISQYLQQNNQIKLSILINQIGKKILSTIIAIQTNDMNRGDQTSAVGTQGPTILSDEIAESIMPKSYYAQIHNEELKALELFVAKERNTQASLSGNEEAPVVYNFINTTSVQHSYKEIQKFRKRPVYMEYLTQVITKALLDPSNDEILGWYDENLAFISKRNDLILEPWRMVIAKGADIIAILGSNENKYAAAVTEFNPEQNKKEQLSGKKKRSAITKRILRAKPSKYYFLTPTKTPEAIRKELEQRQKPVR
ncbi:unnamed protein product [Adineta steineri]|uniref:Uncharacterized protein n=1 Tax=Adineta steineri TaxID=433720 RepID=A0A813SZT0_9BILA|nr:unnamed protein product [Adineta steineri]